MTTTVIVKAHCSDEKEVQVAVITGDGTVKEKFILQDGESADRIVYDDLSITVMEVLKPQ